MKIPLIDAFAAEDIRIQVDKIMRGLGNPEPPIKLNEVRELLRLDLQYYSSTRTGPLQELASRVTVGAKQILSRPGLILEAVRTCNLKALYIPDRKRILIDEDLHNLKKRHAEAHEITHSITPHHGQYLLGDDQETLSSACHERLEAEANYGSGQLLFPAKRFFEEASDLPRSMDVVRDLAKTFGNTITMTLWRLVEEAHEGEPLFGVVCGHPHRPDDDFDPNNPCRYFIESPAFKERFGLVSEATAFEAIKGYAANARGGPLGQSDAVFPGFDGKLHVFHMDTFYNGHSALTLGTYTGPVRTQVLRV